MFASPAMVTPNLDKVFENTILPIIMLREYYSTNYQTLQIQFYQLPSLLLAAVHRKKLKQTCERKSVLLQLGERSIVFESAYVQQAVRIPKLTISNGSTLGENSIQFVQK